MCYDYFMFNTLMSMYIFSILNCFIGDRCEKFTLINYDVGNVILRKSMLMNMVKTRYHLINLTLSALQCQQCR